MYQFNSISIGVLVFFIFVLLLRLLHLYRVEQRLVELRRADRNGDGIITRSELLQTLREELDKKNQQPPKIQSIVKSVASGALRGCLMGLLLNGVEGAISGAVVLGVINPIITSVEYHL